MITTTSLFLSLLSLPSVLSHDHHHVTNLRLTHHQNSLISSDAHLLQSVNLEFENQISRKLTILGCSSYEQSQDLQAMITEAEYPSHPVYSSWEEQKVCYSFHATGTPDSILKPLEAKKTEAMEFTIIPHLVKFDESIHQHVETESDVGYVLDIAMGVGVQGKGIHSDSHLKISQEIIHKARHLHSSHEDLTRHWDNFFWTSKYATAVTSSLLSLTDIVKRQEKYKSIKAKSCNFDELTSEMGSRSSLHLTSMNAPQDSLSSHCMLFLASIASMHEDVSHVHLYRGYEKLETTAPAKVLGTSTPVSNPNVSATDQNAWIQSGADHTTPYSDRGLTGQGYILGFIDSGVDDLSCYLIDSSRTPTPRTARDDYANPITEYQRRKVIQYVAYGDAYPDLDYDHGTWCAGAAVGAITDTAAKKFPKGPSFNGLCPDAKLTMFDVQARGKGMYVPSLYHIAFPPAYNAGVRVHSNSWGCRGMTSYTSKALDVDEFMYEKDDFLVVMAAGNDGALGMDSVGSPGVSKSALTIGASAENHNDIIDFSGIGKAFNGLIKPDVIGPGTNLMSTGVSNDDHHESCNVQLSSGTSMATPMIASTTLIVKEYLENQNYWGSFCNSSYRSCPDIIPSPSSSHHKKKKSKADMDTAEVPRHVSSSLLKAILVHSATDMKQVLGNLWTQIPTTNLTAPPDRFQGWGQVILQNVLPLPGLYNIDLYLAQHEELTSLTRRTYPAIVTHRESPLCVTIVWNDPPNVVWAAKNLLNDIDLMVVSPKGEVFYGNNRKGDEFNPVEKVVINHPVKGEYKVHVTSKQFVYGSSQSYSIVITSLGYVEESKVTTIPITFEELNFDAATTACLSTSSKAQLVRFQIEDWKAGLSWPNIYFTISQWNAHESKAGENVYIKTFISNHDRRDAVTNRIEQFSVCLEKGKKYYSQLEILSDGDMSEDLIKDNMRYVRVSSPNCNLQLSKYWQTSFLELNSEGVCNYCDASKHQKKLEVIMLANVTDDDFIDYSW
jgi:hypothetical protein